MNELTPKEINQIKSLLPIKIDPTTEAEARKLYEMSCNGSRDLIEKLASKEFIDFSSEERLDFINAVHNGMFEAQEHIIDSVLSCDEISDSRELIFTGIMDAIAWTLINFELAHARRLYKEQKKVDLKNSNFESVVLASRQFRLENKNSMPLISDLTSFVQVGDILARTEKGTVIAEVKEGAVNKKFVDFLHFYEAYKCEKSMDLFKETLDKKNIKQLDRMIRQKNRMKHVANIMTSGDDVDPDSGKRIVISDASVSVDRWITEFNESLDNKDNKSFLLNVIDNCLFLGYYFNEDSIKFGPIAFNFWFEQFGATDGSPRTTIFNSMLVPLGLPIFSYFIDPEHKFDLLYKRKHVCMGLNVPAFLAECERNEVKFRYGNNRETSQLEQEGYCPYKFRGKSIFLSSNGKEFCLSDGIFIRIFFHFQSPISTIKAMFENLSSEAD
jgi:hypothetical protein